MPHACHKNVSSQNSYGFVLKNDGDLTPEHGHLGLPWVHVYGSTYHVYCYEFIITIVGINALQYIQSIVTQTWVK